MPELESEMPKLTREALLKEILKSSIKLSSGKKTKASEKLQLHFPMVVQKNLSTEIFPSGFISDYKSNLISSYLKGAWAYHHVGGT